MEDMGILTSRLRFGTKNFIKGVGNGIIGAARFNGLKVKKG